MSRVKHDFDSEIAYKNLLYRLGSKLDINSPFNNFHDPKVGLLKEKHHYYHALSTFYGSGFPDSAILVIDGQGPEFGKNVSTSLWYGDLTGLRLVENFETNLTFFVDNSVGHFYTAIGALAGMHNLHEEGKTMGLASYGEDSEFLEYFRKFLVTDKNGILSVNGALTKAILNNTLGSKFYGWEEQDFGSRQIWNELLRIKKAPLMGVCSKLSNFFKECVQRFLFVYLHSFCNLIFFCIASILLPLVSDVPKNC
ncbi:hypothetical protein H6501_05335 [Candidatus Woesearchaeota archaeon]|nr:hypothetical protein [Nanoarchaeota archaeon]MCB9370997.1 hypothetical protein [Candidatus Woesearchaeota archaeon]USN44099.1 MAG: hypothetical protein H6500_06955 [Candidatus Woesearchaeota archaeon]